MCSTYQFMILKLLVYSFHFASIAAWTTGPPLHLMYYLHENRGTGPNSTTLTAAGTDQGKDSVGWGSFLVYENPLTEGPATDSKLLGISTGSAAVTTKGGVASGGLQISAQHIFNEASGYNGSSITVTGTTESPLGPPWEVIVPGGTGYFRGYQGYGFLEPVAAYTKPPIFVQKWNLYLSKH